MKPGFFRGNAVTILVFCGFAWTIWTRHQGDDAPAPAPPIAASVSTPAPAGDWVAARNDIYVERTQDPAVRTIHTDPANPIFVYNRDMVPGVTRTVICPDPGPMLATRSAVAGNDMTALTAAAEGHHCILAMTASGPVTAVHLQRLVQVQFQIIVGEDFDTGQPLRLEPPDQPYWAISTQLGTVPDNDRLEPLIAAAFR